MRKVQSGVWLSLFGVLRILRALIGVWACALAVNVFAGCAAALNDGVGEKGIAFLVAQGTLFVIVVLAFAVLRLLIHVIHRRVYGTPHPRLVKRFAL